jgi:NAD(P)-dependent dehydrogenase (short-subunit alcohol dehydrogenase family)
MGGIGKSCVEKFVDQGDQVVFTYAEKNLIRLQQKNMSHL